MTVLADSYSLVWHGRYSIESFSDLEEVLALLEAYKLPPTHFGIPDALDRAYDRKAIRLWWDEHRGRPVGLELYRREKPTYTLTAMSDWGPGYWCPRLACGGCPSMKWPVRLFELHRRLSLLMRPFFATVLPHFKGERWVWEDHAAYHITTRDDLLVFGLPPLGTRTWLGPNAVDRIGLERLRRTPGIVLREHDDGAAEVDLAQEPWNLDGPARLKRARTVTTSLAESGAFGDYSTSLREDRRPNPQWVPPSDA